MPPSSAERRTIGHLESRLIHQAPPPSLGALHPEIFPVTAGFPGGGADAFVMKLNPAGRRFDRIQ